VAVFAASNFPFAFSVAGGDTASALAAGCAVVVKAHEAHPATSALTAAIVTDALQSAGAPPGLFAVVYGRAVGTALVQHCAIKAVGFTGSQRGGRALFDLATRRPDPIPFYGELGSSNPVVILPGAAADDPDGLAKAYLGSLTMGTGQFCTNPGLLLVPEDGDLLAAIAEAAGAAPAGPMLTSGMRDAYDSAAQRLSTTGTVSVLAAGRSGNTDGWDVIPRVFQTDTAAFVPQTELRDEVFGPAGLVVTYGSHQELKTAVNALGGSLAAAVHAAPRELRLAGELLGLLRQRAGRVILNGWPTGVAVVWAMHHGGPWPATTAPRDTSVGARAIDRWLVPVAYQGWPDELLPPELRDDNPLRISRTTHSIAAG
jgi:NADP-dependent aldehyde dehydrogenase